MTKHEEKSLLTNGYLLLTTYYFTIYYLLFVTCYFTIYGEKRLMTVYYVVLLTLHYWLFTTEFLWFTKSLMAIYY